MNADRSARQCLGEVVGALQPVRSDRPGRHHARRVGRLRPILRAAQRQRAFVNFDMEQYAFKDVTLHIFRKILEEDEFRDWPDVGIAIQAYLRDTRATTCTSLLDWARRRGTPVWVRLIKGAYWDFETVQAAQEGWPVPVFAAKMADRRKLRDS